MSELHASLFASDVLVHGQVLHSVGRLSTNDMTYMYIIFVDIKKLHDKETWSVDADDERGGVTVLVGTFCSFVKIKHTTWWSVTSVMLDFEILVAWFINCIKNVLMTFHSARSV